jgi:hypothetical protein
MRTIKTQLNPPTKWIVGLRAAVIVSLAGSAETQARQAVDEEVEIPAGGSWETNPVDVGVGAKADGLINLKGAPSWRWQSEKGAEARVWR